MVTPFLRVLHISDLHFSSGGPPQPNDGRNRSQEEPHEVLLRELARLKLKAPSAEYWPKAVIVSGDLVHRGDRQAFPLAVSFLQSVANEFDLPGTRIFVVPG